MAAGWAVWWSLARRRSWDGVDEADRADAFVRCDAFGHQGLKLGAVHFATGNGDGDGDLAMCLVWAWDDGDVGDSGVGGKQRLELRGCHLVGGDLDEFLEPIDDEDVPNGHALPHP